MFDAFNSVCRSRTLKLYTTMFVTYCNCVLIDLTYFLFTANFTIRRKLYNDSFPQPLF
jgi:hypothetical protein